MGKVGVRARAKPTAGATAPLAALGTGKLDSGGRRGGRGERLVPVSKARWPS